ncbi:MAG TPA: hypothetical protein VHS80_00380, partial [Chthoniobacterales bacterium]|nr:hypothetical protein [Chthoniobacterales bacterium]
MIVRLLYVAPTELARFLTPNAIKILLLTELTPFRTKSGHRLSFYDRLCPIPVMFEDKFGLRRRLHRFGLSAVMSGLLAVPVLAQTPGQVFMRYPTIHGESVVFEACGNLWLVDRKGGTAQRLTT